MRSLRTRLDRLSRAAAAGDTVSRLVAVIAWGDEHATVRAGRTAWSLVVPSTEAVDRGGGFGDEALAALTDEQRSLLRPQDKVVILRYPPGSEPPRIETCGL